MNDIDDNVNLPDINQDEDELPTKPAREQKNIDYGFLAYIDEAGEYNMELYGQERGNLNGLLGLAELARQKILTMWQSQHDPSAQAILRDLAVIKRGDAKHGRALQAITDLLKIIYAALGANEPDGDEADDASEA